MSPWAYLGLAWRGLKPEKQHSTEVPAVAHAHAHAVSDQLETVSIVCALVLQRLLPTEQHVSAASM
jgi:hypothetical protein